MMKTVFKVALIALLWITVVNRGTLGSWDTSSRLDVAHAWWTGTEEVAPTFQPHSRLDGVNIVIGVGGKRYIAYDLGQSFLMLPGDWLGTQLHQFFPKASLIDLRHAVVSYLIFIPLNVAAVVSCFLLLRLLGFGEGISGLTTIAWLMCTTVFLYAQEHQQNNQILLFVTIGYASVLAYIKFRKPYFAVCSGLAISAALLIRASSIIHVLTVILFLVGCVAYQSRDKLKVLSVIGLWIVGFFPLGLLGRVLDYIRYGSFWTTGQAFATQQITTASMYSGFPELPANFPFINPPHVGILGVLISPAKSIFIYDPLLLPCLVLSIVYWKRFSPYIQWYIVTGLLNLALNIMLTSRLVFWGGDWAWGARYHVTSVHLLLIPLIAIFIKHSLSNKGLTLWIMRGILAIALMVQIASVTMYYGTEISPVLLPQDFAAEVHFDQFRLGQRVINIICYFNSFFSKHCMRNVPILPFRSNPKIFLPVWRVLLVFAIGTTAWFVYTFWLKARRMLSESAIQSNAISE
jgi:hypothetical protein